MSMKPNRHVIALVMVATACACGGNKDGDKSADNQPEAKTPATGDKAGVATPATRTTPATTPRTEPAAPRPAIRPMGAAKITDYNYEYGKGAGAFKKVADAAKRGDWAAVAEACQAALAKDPWHLDAHFQRALALVQLGQGDAAVDHFDTALAGDWLGFGATLKERAELASFWATDAGQKVEALSQAYGEALIARARTGIWMLGRRTRYKAPDKAGEQWSSTRGELFAYDEESKRYLRLTHTRERIAGWLRSPTGDEIAWVGYWQVVMPEPAAEPGAEAAAARPIFRRTLVGVIDAKTLLPIGETAVLREDIKRADLQYRVGDELIVSVYGAAADPAGGPSARYTLDKVKSRLKKADVEPSDEPVLSMTMDKTWLSEPGAGSGKGYEITDGEDGEMLVIDGSEQGVALPGDSSVTGVSLSADKAYALVTTVAEPCPDPPSGSLYLLETATGKMTHILRGNSAFQSRWLDDHRFVYEDDGGRLRIHDAAAGAQVERLKNGATLALVGLGAIDGIVCPR